MLMTVRPVSRRRQTPAPRSVFLAVTVLPSHCVRDRLSLGFTSCSTFLCSLGVSCSSVLFDDTSYLSLFLHLFVVLSAAAAASFDVTGLLL